MPAATQAPPQVIRGDEVYSVPEFRRRAGLGDFAYRQARRDGLRVVAVGKKRFVRGLDWLDFLAVKASEEKNAENGGEDQNSDRP